MFTEENFKHHLLILYDGDCVFCSQSIQFIIKHNSDKNLYFSALQSNVSQEILSHFALQHTALHTLYFIAEGKCCQKSTAVLEISKYLAIPLRWFQYFSFIPLKWRDGIYERIAKNRHHFFKNKKCWIPTSEELHRFLS